MKTTHGVMVVVAVGASAAMLATERGRRLVRRSIAAYLQPSISFLPEDSDLAPGSQPRPRD